MSAEPLHDADGDGPAVKATPDTMEQAQQALKAGLATLEQRLAEAVKTVERIVSDGVDAVRVQTEAYSGPAGDGLSKAQRYVVERVKERPVTATLAGLGIGLLIGSLLTNRGK